MSDKISESSRRVKQFVKNKDLTPFFSFYYFLGNIMVKIFLAKRGQYKEGLRQQPPQYQIELEPYHNGFVR